MPRFTLPAAASLPVVLLLALAPPAAAQVENGQVAYSGDRAGSRVVYTRNANGRRLRVVPVGAPSDDPAFSPRGRRLAFTRRGDLGSQVWIAYRSGVGLRQLTTGPSDGMASWSPGGGDLVFARGPRRRRDLYAIRADGSGLRRLTVHTADEHSPAWSALERVAFVRHGRAGDDIYVLPAAGGTARALARSRGNDQHPAWSPSGRTLVFARGRPGRRDLYLIRADGSRKRRLTKVPGDESEPAWSPDGSRVAFVHRVRGRRRLFVMKVKGDEVTRLPSRGLRVRRLTSSRSRPRLPSWQPTGLDPVVAAAGDIACSPDSPHFNGGVGLPGVCRQRMTSDLLLRMDLWSILAAGDLQYEDGKLWKFQAAFHPSWGRLKELIRPVAGNHEYRDPGAAGYFDYFNGPGVASGPAGGRGAGYYSFDLDRWHVIALNSECSQVGGCGDGSPQLEWLRADLAAHPTACTLVYWHRPHFSSGEHGGSGETLPVWDVLYAANADLVLNGHEHLYERFAPQTPTGAADPERGIRQFTAGVGGRSRHRFATVASNSEVRDNRTLGVLELTLRDDGYDWRLLGAPTGRVADSGSAACH